MAVVTGEGLQSRTEDLKTSFLLEQYVTEYNEKQLKMIMEHRLRVLNTQKEKVDLTIPLVTKFIEELDKSVT